MGGTASTRRVTFEADENENITVVKGIRVSDSGRAEGQHSDSNPVSLAFPGSARPTFPQFCHQSVVRPKAEFLAKKVEVSQDLGHLFRDISCCVPSAEHCAGATGGCQVDLDLVRAQRPV